MSENEKNEPRPFHETVIDAIRQISSEGELIFSALWIIGTIIPKNHDLIIEEWKKAMRRIGCVRDYGVIAHVLEQKEKFTKKSIIKETIHLKLVADNITTSELTKTFNPVNHFTNGKIKYWLGDYFRKYVLGGTKSLFKMPVMSFSKHSLKTGTDDKDIMSELGISKEAKMMTKEEIIWTIADKTSKQPNGESGELLTNGYATIIGYMLCYDGVIRVAFVYWDIEFCEWDCNCHDLDYRNTGRDVFSRNDTL